MPNAFCVMDGEFRPIIVNQIAREAFYDYFTAIAKGGSHLEAHYAGVRRAMRDVSDAECWHIAQEIADHLAEGTPIDLMTHDGKILRAHSRAMKRGGYVTFHIDVTELRERKQQLLALQQEAEAANLAKSAFLGNMSHEIRTPLNGILGMVQILADGGLDADEREMVEIVLDSAQTLKGLLDDVFDLSKIEAGHVSLAPADCAIEPLLKRQHSLWLPRAQEKNISLTLDMAADLPKCLRFDASRFGQCLSNLISNAIKFTAEGEVSVRVAAGPASPGFLLKIEVSDTGIGMNPETRDRLFRPYTQADNTISSRFGGTGLGLVITRKLAQLMGGDVTISGEEGKGSTFTLTIQAEATQSPLVETAIGGLEPLGVPVGSLAVSCGARILVVDDHKVNRRVVRMFLQPEGYVVSEAENGLQALEMLRREPFNLVLLDIHMPVLDGLQTLKKLRSSGETWRNIPVIAVTADAMSGDRERYLAEGMNGYLPKPVDKAQLLANIARILKPNAGAEMPPASGKSQSTAVSTTALETKVGRSPVNEPVPVERRWAHLQSAPPCAVSTAASRWPQYIAPQRSASADEGRPPATYQKAASGNDLMLQLQEAIEELPHGFSIHDSDLKTIMANRRSRETYGAYYAAMNRGLTQREAIFLEVRRNMPHASEEECWKASDWIAAQMRAGAPADMRTGGRIYRAVYRKMSSGYYVAVSMDITDERNRQKELHIARQRADAANQAKSAFLANMSHELRTPLNGILGMAQVLVQRDFDTQRQEQAETILESGYALKSLLDDVLDLSKIEAGCMELATVDHNLGQLFERVRSTWEPHALRKGIGFSHHFAGPTPGILRFDPARLEQCLSHLVSNAIKFTEHGRVDITIASAPAADGINVTITVSDTGIGMSADTMARLFNPFTQADSSISRRFGGSGLGLIITRKLARLMGGDATIVSREGEGSTATLSVKADYASARAYKYDRPLALGS